MTALPLALASRMRYKSTSCHVNEHSCQRDPVIVRSTVVNRLKVTKQVIEMRLSAHVEVRRLTLALRHRSSYRSPHRGLR